VTAALAVGALVVAACGGHSSSKSGNTTSSTSSTSGSSGSLNPDFGTQKNVCEGGNPSGSTDRGVTPTTVRIATFSDPGFAGRQGLNQELFDTADVFAAWCNARGGIDGRHIVVDKRDAALTNVKPRMQESCQQDFMMVGGGAVFDQDGVEMRLKCLLPDIAGYVVSPKARASDLLVQPVPNPVDVLAIGDAKYLAKKYPDSTKAYGTLVGDIDATKVTGAQHEEALDALGWKKVYSGTYPAAGPSSWAQYAAAIKSAGVKGLVWEGEPENLAHLLQELHNQGVKLDWIRTDANHYDQSLIQIAGPALADKNVYVYSSFEPFEGASPDSPTGQYLQAFKDYKPNGKNRTYLGLQAWSAWLLFAKAAKACGNDLTRGCVYKNAKAETSWDGGGLHAPQDLTGKNPQGCFVLEQATPSGFKLIKVNPNNGIFNCSPDNVYTLKKNYGSGVTLADVGQSLSNLPGYNSTK
jgi:ABC-type branched-subunit amino acid transport system substrate-binding protein